LELTVPSLDEQTATPVERQRRTGPTGPLLPEIAAEIESRRQDFLTGLEEDLASMEEEELAASGSTRTAVAIPVAVPGSLPEVVTSAVPTQPLPALRPAVQAEGEAWPALDDRLLDLPPPAASPPFSEQSESADSSAEPLPPTVPARPFPPTLAGEGGGPPPRQGAAPGVGEGVPLLPFEWLEQPQAWRMGAVVAGRYRLAGTLGHGGMGEVLLAEDLLLRRKVALKALRRNLNAAKNVQALERFRQEVAMAHAVSHVGIARTFDMGETGGVSFLSMEYLDGETLASRLRREGPLPVAEVRRIGLEVASALDAAHQAGVIHRDLKPSNIQLTPDRGAVVLDFGLAAAIADRRGSRHGDGRSELLRPSSKSAGTPNYMAPEQWRGELQGVATDIYSFGCILFEATAGRLPFQGSTRATMMHAHLEEKPPSVRSLCSGVPRSLDQLITACLQKEIKDRPRTMFDVAQKLVELRLHHALVTAALALASLLLLLAGGVTIWKTSSHLLLREIRPAVKR
ncbi:MAG: serine/threonine protein kinase, partial [Deltaproteobacteria bacterium]|nr:serine/threonine protein kinase [Deltaproteobacteria bacterium]